VASRDSDKADTDRDTDARGGVALVTRAFDRLKAATETDPAFAPGAHGLPRTETEARTRALSIVDLLDDNGEARPDRFVQAIVDIGQGQRLHVAPVYAMRIGTAPPVDAVVDPFLRTSPVTLDEWKKLLDVVAVVFLFPEVLLAGREEAMTAPIAVSPRVLDDITTQRRGQGTAEDCHGLARLLTAWLNKPEDKKQVERFRAMFGELTWRALQHTYPELVNAVEHELNRSGSSGA
jgi:hypothetical protein